MYEGIVYMLKNLKGIAYKALDWKLIFFFYIVLWGWKFCVHIWFITLLGERRYPKSKKKAKKIRGGVNRQFIY